MAFGHVSRLVRENEEDFPGFEILAQGAGEEDVELILEKLWRVLAVPGELVIHDYLLDAGGGQTLYASLFNLTMLVGTPRGRCYSVDEMKVMLTRLHAAEVKTVPIGLGTSLIVAKKIFQGGKE